MNKILRGQRGFMLLNVVFLTLITSFAAMLLMNAAPRVRNREATLKLTAIHLANEQFAQLESMAAAGTEIFGVNNFLGDKNDLTTKNGVGTNEEIKTITFVVKTDVAIISAVKDEDGNPILRKATVTVTWTEGGKNFELTAERTIRFVKEP